MDSRAAVLKASFDAAHMTFNAVVDGLTSDIAAHRLPGSTVPPALAIIAHAIYSQDMMLNEHVRGGPTLLESSGLGPRTGITTPAPQMTPGWLDLSFNLDGLREYAAAVFAATSAFIDSATSADLDREIPHPLATFSAAEYLAGLGVVHLAEHTGEISALKGIQGARGLPF